MPVEGAGLCRGAMEVSKKFNVSHDRVIELWHELKIEGLLIIKKILLRM